MISSDPFLVFLPLDTDICKCFLQHDTDKDSMFCQVYWTKEGKGWGLRTLEDLPPGTFVCEYVGEILTSSEMKERKVAIQTLGKNTFPLQLGAKQCSERSVEQEEVFCLDATYYGNVARFINHRLHIISGPHKSVIYYDFLLVKDQQA